MNFFVFDTETTGVEAGSRMVEIHAAICSDDGDIVQEWGTLIDPGMPIPPDATATNGITNAMITDAPSAFGALVDFSDFIAGHGVGIGHFVGFDLGMIHYAMGAFDVTSQCISDLETICTCEMAKAIKATKKNSLDALVEHYQIQRRSDAHRAASDVHACLSYYQIARKLATPVPKIFVPEYSYADPEKLTGPLSGLSSAVASGSSIAFTYVDAHGNRTDREVIPYGWANTAKGIQFHGLCLAKNERRTFLADRVVS